MAALLPLPGLSLMKIQSAIVLSLFGVTTVVWWSLWSDCDRIPQGTSRSVSREAGVPHVPGTVGNQTIAGAVSDQGIVADDRVVTPGRDIRSRPLSPALNAGIPEEDPSAGFRKTPRVRASFPLSQSDVASHATPFSGRGTGAVAAVPSVAVLPKAPVDASQPARQPAVWVDLGPDAGLTELQQEEVQAAAVALQQQLEASGLDSGSPEYRALWEKSVADSDRIFRQRYGGQAWMAHHIQAFHLGHTATSP